MKKNLNLKKSLNSRN